MKKPTVLMFRGPDGKVISKEGETLEAAILKLGSGVSFDGEGLNTFDVIQHGKTVKYTFIGHHEGKKA